MIAKHSDELMKSTEHSVLYDFDVDSDVLMINFAGVGIGMGVPYFEFSRMLNDQKVKKIFVRDHAKSWYHAGLHGVGNNIDECVEPLKKLIAESGAKYVITMGNSMGAYAAILYAVLLEADEALAFAPTTFANLSLQIRHWDIRKHFTYMRKSPVQMKKYFNLAKVPGMEKPRVNIFFDTDYRNDRVHAENLGKRFDNVHLRRYHGGKHAVIKLIKKSGDLSRILSETISHAHQPKAPISA
ncbi:MAG: hypothetical protein AAFU60_04005 [Bacteroidota bacterium]